MFPDTDKHDSLRTKESDLPTKSSARLLVPGYKDSMSYSLRLDAPTGRRTSVNVLLILISAKKWRVMCLLKGEEAKSSKMASGS